MSGEFPDIRYADADGVSIAYAVSGDGPVDLVRVPDVMSGILVGLVDPWVAAFNERLARFSRLVRLDRRGLGLSDPLLSGAVPPLEQQVDDVLAVMDALGIERAALHGGGDGGQVAILVAATHPERVDALVLNSAFARAFRSRGYPYGSDRESRARIGDRMRADWGDLERPWGIATFAAHRQDEPGLSQLLARRQQVSASPGAASAVFLHEGNDVRDVLPLVQAPTLVLSPAGGHPRMETLQLLDHARYLVDHIPDARLATFAGVDAYLDTDMEERAALIEEFLTGTRPAPPSDRVLATVLFTDIVGSTVRAARTGDDAWRFELDRHDAMVRHALTRFRGRAVKATGDGVFAVFDGPARAVRCAETIVERARVLGLDVRAGVHTGECETRGDDYAGIAVHIGARVCELAHPGEVLATSTVRDLTVGSGIEFVERSAGALRGVPGEWTIFTVKG